MSAVIMATIRGWTGPVPEVMIRAASRSLSTNVRSAGAAASPRLKRSKVDSSPRARGVDARAIGLDAPLPLAGAAVDAAWLGETLEHLVDPVGTLHEVGRV